MSASAPAYQEIIISMRQANKQTKMKPSTKQKYDDDADDDDDIVVFVGDDKFPLDC